MMFLMILFSCKKGLRKGILGYMGVCKGTERIVHQEKDGVNMKCNVGS